MFITSKFYSMWWWGGGISRIEGPWRSVNRHSGVTRFRYRKFTSACKPPKILYGVEGDQRFSHCLLFFLLLTFKTHTFSDCLLWFIFSFWGWVMGSPGRKNGVNASVVRWELIADTPFSFLTDTVQTRLQHSRNACGKAALKQSCLGCFHKVLTCIEYRAVSGVFRTIDPQRVCPPPRTKGYTLAGRWGDGG